MLTVRESAPGVAQLPEDPRRVRAEILRRYARLSNKGRPRICSPRAVERSGVLRENKGSNGKIIYPDLARAEAAAAALEAAGFGAHQAYPCERSRHGHFHLTTRRPPVDAAHGRCRVCGHLLVLERGAVVAHTSSAGSLRLCAGSRQPPRAPAPPVPAQRDTPTEARPAGPPEVGAPQVGAPQVGVPAAEPAAPQPRRRAGALAVGLLVAAAALVALYLLLARG